VVEKPKRHTKPQLSRNGAEEYRRVLAGAGRADGLEVADVIHAITQAAGLDGEAVRDVRVLERFTLFSVPDSEADRIIAAVDGSELAGRELRVELART
jgi:ATP-dependent RNA helicase DeaD